MSRTLTALVLMALLLGAPLASAVDAREADVIDTSQTLTEDATYDEGFTVIAFLHPIKANECVVCFV